VSSWSFDFTNRHTSPVTLEVWLEPQCKYIELGDDGVSWSSPITQGSAISLSLAADGGTDTLHVRRTIPAGTARHPGRSVHLIYQADDGATTEDGEARGWYRIFGLDTATYSAYNGTAASPPNVQGDTAWDTFTSFPHEVDDALGNDTHLLTLTLDNGIHVSPPGRPVALRVAAGAEETLAPSAPRDLAQANIGAGVVRVTASYAAARDADAAAGTWVAVYDDNSDFSSPSGEQTATVSANNQGMAHLSLDLPAQGHGADCYVKLWMRRGSGGSAVDGPAVYTGPLVVTATYTGVVQYGSQSQEGLGA
jgi:hypothetical protein